MENQQAVQYLDSLLGKTLRIYTTDTRLFVGMFKCTDKDRNIILATTREFRYPSRSTVTEAIDQLATSSEATVKLDMNRRFIGLVVVPGQYITKIEVEDVTG